MLEPAAPDLFVRASVNGQVTYCILCDPPPDWARKQFDGLEPQAVRLHVGEAEKMRLEDMARLDAGLAKDFTLEQIVKVWRVMYG